VKLTLSTRKCWAGLASIGMVILSTQAWSGSSSANMGTSTTMGPTSSSFSLHGAFNNPAMNPLLVNTDESFRMSYFPNISYNMELGDLDNFTEDLDDLINLIDNPADNVDSASDTLDRFNDVVKLMGEQGYLKINVGIDAPLLPLIYKSDFLGGAIGFGAKTGVQIGMSVLDDNLGISTQGGGIETNTSLYLKSGLETTLSLSYGREIFALTDLGKLYVGAKLNLISMELSKQVVPLTTLDGKDVGDVISDTYDQNLEKATAMGIDVGLVWAAKDYRLGLTFENINAPEFDYGSVGINCASRGEQNDARDQCETASFFVQNGRINSTESHIKQALMRVDALYSITERLVVSAAYDTAEYNDTIGFDNQWFNAATSYDPVHPLIPDLRIGYQKNLAGTELSSLTAGLTLFSLVSLDLEYGLESTAVDGSELPRRFGFSFSIAESF